MKAKDRIAVSALRSALAAIDDAETVPAAPQPGVEASEHVAGAAAAGIGAADVARKQLTEEEMRAVVAREHRERVAAAMTYAELGRNQDAGRARAEADVLARYL